MASVGSIKIQCPECHEELQIPVHVAPAPSGATVLNLSWDREAVDSHISWCPALVEVDADMLIEEIERALRDASG